MENEMSKVKRGNKEKMLEGERERKNQGCGMEKRKKKGKKRKGISCSYISALLRLHS